MVRGGAGDPYTRHHNAQSLPSPGHIAFRAGLEGLPPRPQHACVESHTPLRVRLPVVHTDYYR